MSFIDLATQFKIRMYQLNREKRCNAFPRSTDIIQILNKLPTDKRHIKVSQDRQLHTSTKMKVFENVIVKCVTIPQ